MAIELFNTFPYIKSERLLIRKMEENDLDALEKITGNENVYRYIPPFLYKKSRGNLLAAIKNLSGRDFDKKKLIIAGVYLQSEPNNLIGLAELFDYKKRIGQITIGYRLNESYWHQGIATELVTLLVKYLYVDMEIPTIKAFVMPENVYSSKALIKNGFKKEKTMTTGKNWGGKDTVNLEEYTYCR